MALLKAILYTIIICVLLFTAIKKKDSKILFSIIVVLCWMAIALSLQSYDINNYRQAYDRQALRHKDYLFDLLQLLFTALGAPFDVFKVLYCTLICILLFWGMTKYTKATALAAILFVFGPMFGFGTQLRSTMAGVIVLNAIPLLLKKDAKIWKYCLVVLVACGFHLMAAFYFIFLIPKLFRCDSAKFRKVLFVIALAMIPGILIFAKPLSQLMLYMARIIPISFISSMLVRLAPYFSGELSPNIKGFLYNACFQAVLLFAADRMCMAMKGLRREVSGEARKHLLFSDDALDYLHKLNSLMFLLPPCNLMCMQFDRFFNYFLPVCCCLFAQGLLELQRTGIRAPITGILELAPVKKIRFLRENKLPILTDEKKGLLQPANFELALVVSCLLFCLFVGTWIAGPEGFIDHINNIGVFRGN